MAVRASLTESNAELQAELRMANEDLGELRAHHRANLRELERLRRFESDGLDLERLAPREAGVRLRVLPQQERDDHEGEQGVEDEDQGCHRITCRR